MSGSNKELLGYKRILESWGFKFIDGPALEASTGIGKLDEGTFLVEFDRLVYEQVKVMSGGVPKWWQDEEGVSVGSLIRAYQNELTRRANSPTINPANWVKHDNVWIHPDGYTVWRDTFILHGGGGGRAKTGWWESYYCIDDAKWKSVDEFKCYTTPEKAVSALEAFAKSRKKA